MDLKIPPGILRSQTAGAGAGRWIDSLNFRFRSGRPQKIGGYVKYLDEQFIGTGRGFIAWTTEAGNSIQNLGTDVKLYAFDDTLYDITPLDASGTLTDPFSTTDTSAVITVADVAHGRAVGAYVIFDGATAVGGVTVDGTYTVTSVIDADSYTITHSAPATSTAGPGGGSVDYEYELNPGNVSSTEGLGWGSGGWGEGTWGTPRTDGGVVTELRRWFFAPYGVDMLCLPSGGTLYLWDESTTDGRAAAVSNAPASSRAMFKTAEGYVTLLGVDTPAVGSGGPMTMAWPDRDDITLFLPDAENTANVRDVYVGNKLMGGTALESINLIWTDTAIYLHQYTGGDFIYDTRLIGENAGLIGPGAFTTAGAPAAAYWFSRAGFMMFDGSVHAIPRQDEDGWRDAVFREIDVSHAHKFWCAFFPRFSEVWFGYVSNDSPDGEPDKYAAVSLIDWSWFGGDLARTDATVQQGTDRSILMVGQDRYVYEHETGTDADGGALEAYIRLGSMKMGDGTRDFDVTRYIHDVERQVGDVEVVIRTKNRPNSQDYLDEYSFTLLPTGEEEDMMLSGRHVDIEFTTNVVGGDIRFGVQTLIVVPAGER